LMADAESSRHTPCAVAAEAGEESNGTRSVPATDPPNVACSADLAFPAAEQTSAAEDFAASDSEDDVSDDSAATHEQALQGLALMENRLLPLIAQAGNQDPERRASLEESLANIRRSKATLEIKISPQQIGATIIAAPDLDVLQLAAPA